MSKGKRKKVLFDIDDTLLDFRTAERNAIRQTFDEFAIPSGESVLAAGSGSSWGR